MIKSAVKQFLSYNPLSGMPFLDKGLQGDSHDYRAIFQGLPAAIYTTDIAGQIILYNAAAAKLWGYRLEIDEDEWRESEHIFTDPMPQEQVLKTKTSKEYLPLRGVEVMVKCADGIKIPFLSFSAPLPDVSGKSTGTVHMLIDNSENKNSQLVLERRNKWLTLLAKTSSELAEAIDSEQMMYSLFQHAFSHTDADIFFNYTVVNEDNHTFLRLEASGGLSKADQNIFSRLEFGQSICGLTAQTERGYIISDMQHEDKWKADALRALGIRAYICQPLIAGDEVIGTLSFGSSKKDSFDAEEIKFIKTISHYVATAKKRLRDEHNIRGSEARARELMQRAESANIAKSKFLANMSHEIRTPMNAIVGLTYILSTQELSKLKQKELFDTLMVSAGQFLDVINNVLDFSEIESTHLELGHIPFHLDILLLEVIGLWKMKASERNIILKVAYIRSPENQFVGDPLRIKQVLMNLVGNAIKFTEQGSVTLHIDCQPVTLDESIILRINVHDTGIGIRQEQIGTIFNKFTQADASATRQFGGTGLGLAICRKLIQAMGGTIDVTSTYGMGSCFSITLPLAVKKDTRVVYQTFDADIPHIESDLQGVHVLLVEDYAPNVLVATILLEEFGCTYSVAENGAIALAMQKEQMFDVVLMDVQMPVMDGLESTRQIRIWEKQYNKPRTPIIGITAHALVGDHKRCIEAGMDDYVTKPFQPNQLKSKIAKYVAPAIKLAAEA